jgi:outer membrane protein assembly factor BamB
MNGKESIVISASNSVVSYEPATGTVQWGFDGVVGNNVPSVSIWDGWMAIASNRKGQCRVLYLREGKPEQIWRSKAASSSFGSPLIHDWRVYFVSKAGILFCHALETGDLLFEHRLPSSTWASPIASGSSIWFFCQNGTTVVLNASDELKVLSQASLQLPAGERVYGVAAIKRHFLFRTDSRVICVEGSQ